MPPRLTAEQRIESDKKKALYMVAWKEANREKFNNYMQNYYLTNKKLINTRRAENALLLRHKLKNKLITPTITP